MIIAKEGNGVQKQLEGDYCNGDNIWISEICKCLKIKSKKLLFQGKGGASRERSAESLEGKLVKQVGTFAAVPHVHTDHCSEQRGITLGKWPVGTDRKSISLGLADSQEKRRREASSTFFVCLLRPGDKQSSETHRKEREG